MTVKWLRKGQDVPILVLQNKEGKQRLLFPTPATSLHCSGSEQDKTERAFIEITPQISTALESRGAMTYS